MCANVVISQGARHVTHISIMRHMYVLYLHVCMHLYLNADNGQGFQVHHKLTELHGLHVFFKLSYKLQGNVKYVAFA